MKKLIALVVMIITLVSILAACEFQPGGGTTDTKKVEYTSLICDDNKVDLLDVRNEISNSVGKIMTISNSSSSVGKGEIVFGETSLAITVAAKSAMESAMKKQENKDIGYIIYAAGESVAVYWSNDDMASEAIQKFVSECVRSNKLVLDEGVIAYEYYSSVSYEKEKYWVALEAQASSEVVSALREAYEFFADPALIGWMANLYDPEIGGFYYSISARDNEPFRPDIESTSQIFSMITGNGAVKNRSYELPENIVKDIVSFAKSLQSAKDGYFYHPQWPQDKELLNTDRYGRDLATASGFITSFYIDTNGDGIKEKQYPNYCIPGGQKCEAHLNGGACSFPISASQVTGAVSASVTRELDNNVSLAVSRIDNSAVIAAASVSSHPDYSSAAAFEAWLRAYNGDLWERDDSGHAHLIAELRFEIVSHGYLDIVLDYLDEQQAMIYDMQIASGETPTGMWQRTADYTAAWGFFKYMALYNLSQGRKIDIKYASYIVETYITVLKTPVDGNYYINDLMNQWTGIQRLISNVKKYYGDEEAQKIYERMREDPAELINNCLEKLIPFKRDDGSFSYNPSGRSLSVIYGVPISLGEVEGDVNGTLLALNIYGAMFSTFGYDAVPLFDSNDGAEFVRIISECSPIEKIERVFEETDYDYETDIDSVRQSQKTPEYKCEITTDPKDSSNNVLYFASGSLGGPGQSDSLQFTVLSAGSGCNVLETKMYIDGKTSDGYIFQCAIMGSYNFTINKSGNKITIKDVSNTDRAADFDVIAETSTNKWFKLRIEYYYPDAMGSSGIDAPVTKIFIDDELVTTSYKYANSDISTTAPSAYTAARFYSMARTETHVYFDDTYFATETKAYDVTDDSITDSRN